MLPLPYLDQFLEFAGAVAELDVADVHAIQHGDPEVVQRGFLAVLNAATLANRTATAASEENGQVVVVVAVTVAVTRTVDDHRVVEERAVAFLDRLQAVEEVSQLRGVENIDVLDLRHLRRVVAVVGKAVVTIAHVDERVRTVAAFVGEDKG